MSNNEQRVPAIGSEGPSSADNDTEPEARSISQVIRLTARLFPERPAIVSTTFAPLTYGDLQQQLNDVQRKIRSAGFDCNARIGISMPNGPEAILAIVTVACCSIAVPLDSRLSRTEIDLRLDMLGLSALIVPQGSASEARELAEERRLPVIEVSPGQDGRLQVILATQVAELAAEDCGPDPGSPAFILQTSGTTAQPKLIPYSHRNMLAAAARLQAWFGLTHLDRCLSVSSPYYSHGLTATIFTPLLTGGSIAVPTSSTNVELDEWLDVLRPTWYSAGPTLHTAVFNKASSVDYIQTAHTLRLVISGGAPLPKQLQNDLERVLGVPVLEHYGSSEAAQIAANVPPPGPNRPGTCGRPWPDMLAIFGQDGRPRPAGEQGEIWVRGPTVIDNYLEAPQLNQTAFSEGWFRTGDIGSLDEDGFLSLHGRLSEQINRGGEKIAPAEVESALMRHPAVAEAVAFAIAHPRLGDDVAAAIVCHLNAQTAPEELRRFLRNELASFKVPRHILILDQLPKGATGKVLRRRLRELLQSDDPGATAPTDENKEPFDLEAELLTLWRKLLKSPAVTIDDDFFASGGDSLLAMEMLVEVERMVGRPLPENILYGSETIRRLTTSIVEATGTPTTPLLQFHPHGDRPPLYFFNGDLISGHLCMRRIVELLGANYPVISIDPHGLHGEPIPGSIEEMAADRLPLILGPQSRGPFLLGGKCNGAMVAFETARLLIAAGHKVHLVAMVDPPTVGARPVPRAILGPMKPMIPPPGLRWIYELLAGLERFFKASRGKQIADLMQLAPKQIARLSDGLTNKGVPADLWDTHSTAMARYFPAPLDVPVTFYAADHEGRGWSFGSPVEVIEVPGGHDGCLTTGAQSLVDDLRRRIDVLAEGAPRELSRPHDLLPLSPRESKASTDPEPGQSVITVPQH